VTQAAFALETLVDGYCDAWNEPDAARRAQLLARVWCERGTYTDPTVHTTGVAELVAHIGRVLDRRPGSRIVRTSVLDSHHGVARFAWCRILADGERLPEGIDFAEADSSGKLCRIIGFFGPLAAQPSAWLTISAAAPGCTTAPPRAGPTVWA
jgi:hypothetical protein